MQLSGYRKARQSRESMMADKRGCGAAASPQQRAETCRAGDLCMRVVREGGLRSTITYS